MNSQEFRNNLLLKRPRYAVSRIPVLDMFSEKGSKSADYSRFGPYYEIYIYAMMLGIKKKQRLPLPPRDLTKDFIEMGKWKRDSSLIDFLLMVIFTQTESLEIDWNEMEDMEQEELNKVVSKVVTLIEEYANGGLAYIEERWGKGELSNSHYMFIDLYNN